MQKPLIHAVLFDLDGTLLDTAADFVRIVQQMAQEFNLMLPTEQAIREQVSEGATAMMRLLHQQVSEPDVKNIGSKSVEPLSLETMRIEFLNRYSDNIAVNTRLFDGLDRLLRDLQQLNIPWGIVTNKPAHLTHKLLQALNLSHLAAVVICPEDVEQTKPNPEPMFKAAQILNVDPKKIVYIGDHPRDIAAGRNAGMPTIIAAYGYLPPDSKHDLANWQADFCVNESDALNFVLKNRFNLQSPSP